MKKFTQIDESSQDNLTFDEKISKLVESLEIIIDNEPEAASKNITVKSSEEFISNIKKLITETYLKDKLSLLDKLKSTMYSGNSSWIEDEITTIQESMKK